MIKQLINNYHGLCTILGIEEAADIEKAKFSIQGSHKVMI